MTKPSPRRRHSRRDPGARHMHIRRQLFDMIQEIIRRDRLNDVALAHIIHTSRPRASTLIHGRIERFNTETLIDILARLGVTVELQVTRVQPYARWHFRSPHRAWTRVPNMVYG